MSEMSESGFEFEAESQTVVLLMSVDAVALAASCDSTILIFVMSSSLAPLSMHCALLASAGLGGAQLVLTRT